LSRTESLATASTLSDLGLLPPFDLTQNTKTGISATEKSIHNTKVKNNAKNI
jgi:hypothetical protein